MEKILKELLYEIMLLSVQRRMEGKDTHDLDIIIEKYKKYNT